MVTTITSSHFDSGYYFCMLESCVADFIDSLPLELLDEPVVQLKPEVRNDDYSDSFCQVWEKPKTAWERIAEGELERIGLCFYNVPDFTSRLALLAGSGETVSFATPAVDVNSAEMQAGGVLGLSVEGLKDGGFFLAVRDPEERGDEPLFQATVGFPDREERRKGARDLVVTMHTGFTNGLSPIHTMSRVLGANSLDIDEQIHNAEKYVPQLEDIFKGQPARRF